MMKDNKIKYKIKGHESFYIRDGWMRKGMKQVEKHSALFSSSNAVDRLGVGANMVKSIRYWLQVTHLTEEKAVKGGKRIQELTPSFGKIINQYDPYFEDLFTLWLLHYHIATNKELATSWYIFYNRFSLTEFTKEELVDGMEHLLQEYIGNQEFSLNSLKDDCTTLIKTYYEEDPLRDPEDNLVCPLSELGLIQQKTNGRGKVIYIKTKPNKDKLHPLLVFYIISQTTDTYNGIPVDILIEQENSVAKILNMDRATLYQYIEELKRLELVTINRTAGLDMIYPVKLSNEDILKKYYTLSKSGVN